jgi:uncharacterized membrane protein
MDSTQLRAIPLFADLTQEEADLLLGMLRPQTLAANQSLFWIGDPGLEFFVIESGRMRVTFPDHTGREIDLAWLSAGNFLGEISLLDGAPRSASARAISDVKLLVLSREQFLQFIRAHPSVAVRIMAELGRRQRETVERLRGVRNVNEVAEEQSSRWHRVAGAIATAAASHPFLIGHAIVFGSWIAMNIGLGHSGPDPFPFPFLAFWASCEAIFLSLFILISQNAQARKDRLRTEVEYQIALKMQLEIMQLHQKIDGLPETLAAAGKKDSP